MNKSGFFVETPRLILRQWKPADSEPFIELNQDSNVMEFFPSLKTREETMIQFKKLSAHINEYGYGFFAVERKDNNHSLDLQVCRTPDLKAILHPALRLAGV